MAWHEIYRFHKELRRLFLIYHLGLMVSATTHVSSPVLRCSMILLLCQKPRLFEALGMHLSLKLYLTFCNQHIFFSLPYNISYK